MAAAKLNLSIFTLKAALKRKNCQYVGNQPVITYWLQPVVSLCLQVKPISETVLAGFVTTGEVACCGGGW